MSYQKHL